MSVISSRLWLIHFTLIFAAGDYYRLKTILKYLRAFLKEEFRVGYFLLMALFLAISITLNYTMGIEKRILYYFNTPMYFWLRLLFYAVPYYFAMVGYCVFYKKAALLRNYRLWLKSLFALVLLAWSCHFNSYAYALQQAFADPYHYLIRKLVFNMSRTLTIVLPLLLFYFFIEREKNLFYGFRVSGFNMKPYLLMLGIMFPLIAWASFQPDFLSVYPTYRAGAAEAYGHIPLWKTITGYEIIYGLDFTVIELFFRGFLVIGFSRLLGKGAIFPMVAAYAFLHFGKPMAETLGSIAGGFILGVIAYYSRSIIGGVLIHMGVALGMDLAANAQVYWLNH